MTRKLSWQRLCDPPTKFSVEEPVALVKKQKLESRNIVQARAAYARKTVNIVPRKIVPLKEPENNSDLLVLLSNVSQVDGGMNSR